MRLPLRGGARAGRDGSSRAPGRPPITPVEVRGASQWWTYRSTKARRELGWTTRPHEETVEATVDWYREREGGPLARSAPRQPLGAARRGLRRARGSARCCGASRRERARLHRCRTPTNWLCPCGRVARELRRRDVEFEKVRVAWRTRDRDEIDELTGQRHVPVLVLEREVIFDSLRIVEHLRWRQSEHS